MKKNSQSIELEYYLKESISPVHYNLRNQKNILKFDLVYISY